MVFKHKLTQPVMKAFTNGIEKNSGFLSAAFKRKVAPFPKRLGEATKDLSNTMAMTGVAGVGLLGYGALRNPPINTSRL